MLTEDHEIRRQVTSLASPTAIVPIDEVAVAGIRERARHYVSELLACDPYSPAFGSKAESLGVLGRREVAALADASGRILERIGKPIGMDAVGSALDELRRVIGELDPRGQRSMAKPRRLFGIIRCGPGLASYFQRYSSAQLAIDGILRTLMASKDELLRQNIAVDGERGRIWEHMERLANVAHLSEAIGVALEAAAGDLNETQPVKAGAVRGEALYQVRRRNTELLEQMSVAMHGYMAMDLVNTSGKELVEAIDRAVGTTVSALRTAAAIAETLAGQRLMLSQIAALNTAATDTLDARRRSRPDRGSRIVPLAAPVPMDMQALEEAFVAIYAEMDTVGASRTAVLRSVRTTIDALGSER
ncbi:toxic anion resistance protein [Sphingomonas sp. R86521]|uniref:toxic anion resistance protein n=1 Tax=Sphingomonas sp. R86521 TaxID=3093860 RepID=UPI0036D3010B